MQIIADWVQPGSRVLDLGCGRGVLLDYLRRKKNTFGIGVDLDFEKISACVRRHISAYQGDMTEFMKCFPDNYFDNVIISRTLEELSHPGAIIKEGLRVGCTLTIGFANSAFWKNRFDLFLGRHRPRNAIYTTEWSAAHPANPASIADFEHFCRTQKIHISRYAYLKGDWHTPCNFLPNFFAGYALYELSV